jgi:hypothetical protein
VPRKPELCAPDVPISAFVADAGAFGDDLRHVFSHLLPSNPGTHL